MQVEDPEKIGAMARIAKTQNDTGGIIDVIKQYFRFILNTFLAFLDDSPMSYCVGGGIRPTQRSIHGPFQVVANLRKLGKITLLSAIARQMSQYVRIE